MKLTHSPKDEDYTVHRMILGTHTSGQADDHLMIAEVHLPKDGIEGRDIGELYDEERQGGLHGMSGAADIRTGLAR